jgi:hypothetical protein
VNFSAFAEDTNLMRRLCAAENCCPYIEAQNRWVPHFLDVHIADQAHCMFLPDGSSLVDFIGASETLDEDWPAVRLCSLRCRGCACLLHCVCMLCMCCAAISSWALQEPLHACAQHCAPAATECDAGSRGCR